MKGDRKAGPLLLIPAALLVIAVIACGSSSNGEPVATSTDVIERLLTTNIEEFNGWLTQALADRDFETLGALMRDPFDIHVFRAGGSQRPPTTAIRQMEQSLFPPEGTAVIDCSGEPGEDVFDTLAIDSTEYYAQAEGVLFCSGWGPEGVGEATLLVDFDDAGSLYWIELTVALNGFAGASR
jgi:hypothetical protein